MVSMQMQEAECRGMEYQAQYLKHSCNSWRQCNNNNLKGGWKCHLINLNH